MFDKKKWLNIVLPKKKRKEKKAHKKSIEIKASWSKLLYFLLTFVFCQLLTFRLITSDCW